MNEPAKKGHNVGGVSAPIGLDGCRISAKCCRTCPEIAKMIGCSTQLLIWWLKKPNAPMATERMKGRRIVRYYDSDEVIKWYAER